MHFNGPAKVSFEAAWGLPWDPAAGTPPARHLRNGICRAHSPSERSAAQRAFVTDVTSLDPGFERVEMGPLTFMCDAIV